MKVIEHGYDDITGAIRYVSTPIGVPSPTNTNPRAWTPFYLPVYPAGSTVGNLMREDVPVENCPDHGPEIAEAAQAIMPSVYPSGYLPSWLSLTRQLPYADRTPSWTERTTYLNRLLRHGREPVGDPGRVTTWQHRHPTGSLTLLMTQQSEADFRAFGGRSFKSIVLVRLSPLCAY
jgi:hypothetical protein